VDDPYANYKTLEIINICIIFTRYDARVL